MLKSQYNVFWEALVITLFVFGTGVLLGVFIESGREGMINEMYLVSEINLLDAEIQTEILNLDDLNCDEAVEKNIEFADRIYEDAKILDKYEGASRLKGSLIQHHRRYDLLRTLLWMNSMKIKERCPENQFHTLVYFYDYQTEDPEQKSKQVVFSRFLEELKEKEGSNIILIPIARNLEIGSLELLIHNYGISQTSVLLDERFLVEDISELYKIEDEIEKSKT